MYKVMLKDGRTENFERFRRAMDRSVEQARRGNSPEIVEVDGSDASRTITWKARGWSKKIPMTGEPEPGAFFDLPITEEPDDGTDPMPVPVKISEYRGQYYITPAINVVGVTDDTRAKNIALAARRVTALSERSDRGATVLVEPSIAFDFVMEADPMPSWALRTCLEHIAESGAIETAGNNSGQTWLAEQCDVSPRTVRRWVAGDSELSGATAKWVRQVIDREWVGASSGEISKKQVDELTAGDIYRHGDGLRIAVRDAELRDWHGGPPKIDFSYT